MSNNLHPPNPSQQLVQAWQKYLNRCFRERDEAVEAILLGLLSGQNIFLLGKPGTAKTALSHAAVKMLDDAKHFETQFFGFLTPEDVFGPVSMSLLAKDIYRRDVTGYLPDSHTVMIDEIFRGGEGLLSGLLTPLESTNRQYINGRERMPLDLYWMICAANSIPAENEDLEALYDRLTIRCQVDYIQDDDTWLGLLRGGLTRPVAPPPALPIARLPEILREVVALPVEDEVWETVLAIRKQLPGEGIALSDRAAVQCLADQDFAGNPIPSVVKAQAWLNGRDRVKKTDLSCLYHTLWKTPDELPKIARVLGRLVNPSDRDGQEFLNKAQELFGQVQALDPRAANAYEQLGKIVKEYTALEEKIKHYLHGRNAADPEFRRIITAGRAVRKFRETVIQKQSALIDGA